MIYFKYIDYELIILDLRMNLQNPVRATKETYNLNPFWDYNHLLRCPTASDY